MVLDGQPISLTLCAGRMICRQGGVYQLERFESMDTSPNVVFILPVALMYRIRCGIAFLSVRRYGIEVALRPSAWINA